jgi:two-component system response regulator DevR
MPRIGPIDVIPQEDARILRLLIVDDHPLFRRGLAGLLKRKKNVHVVGEAATAPEAIDLALQLQPDLILLDIELPDGNGLDVCQELRWRAPHIHIVILSAFYDEELVAHAVSAGAIGYLRKEVDQAGLIHAIELAAHGQSILDPALMKHGVNRLNTPTRELARGLTIPEQRVADLIAKGHTNKEIAEELALSANTVRNYVGRVFGKLHISRRSQVATFFSRLAQRK